MPLPAPKSFRSLVVVLVVAGASGGCLSRALLMGSRGQSYEPVTVAGEVLDNVAVQLTDVTVEIGSHTVTVGVVVRSHGPPALVSGVALATAAAAPCSAGVAASSLTLDDSVRWDRPVGLGGEHNLRLVFDGVAPLLAEPGAVMDIRLAGATSAAGCLRVPLVSPGVLQPAWRPAPHRWSVGAVLRSGLSPDGSTVRVIDDELRVSYWFERFLVGAELGWSVQTCAGRCEGGDDGWVIPVWLLAETIPLRARGFGLGVELAYGLGYGVVEVFSGHLGPRQIVHGPRVALHLLRMTPPVWGGGAVPAGSGLEISISYQRALFGPTPPALLIGFGLVTF